jgi:hypothetical protein
MTNRWPFEHAVREDVALLGLGDYAGVERRSSGVRLSAELLAATVSGYACRLIVPPSGAAARLGVVTHGAGRGWSVEVPLWIAEEGPSDLSLELDRAARARQQVPH